jgi:hypothetical protein
VKQLSGAPDADDAKSDHVLFLLKYLIALFGYIFNLKNIFKRRIFKLDSTIRHFSMSNKPAKQKINFWATFFSSVGNLSLLLKTSDAKTPQKDRPSV